MKIKLSVGFALVSTFIQLLITVLASDEAASDAFTGSLGASLLSGFILFGIFYTLLKYVKFPASHGFPEILHKLANDDGQFDGDLRNFVKDQSSANDGSLRGNLAKLIQRLLAVIDEVNDAAQQLSENSSRATLVAEKTSAGIIKQYDESNSVALTTENISSAVREVADNSNAAADAAKQAGDDAQEGQSVIEGVINSCLLYTSPSPRDS